MLTLFVYVCLCVRVYRSEIELRINTRNENRSTFTICTLRFQVVRHNMRIHQYFGRVNVYTHSRTRPDTHLRKLVKISLSRVSLAEWRRRRRRLRQQLFRHGCKQTNELISIYVRTQLCTTALRSISVYKWLDVCAVQSGSSHIKRTMQLFCVCSFVQNTYYIYYYQWMSNISHNNSSQSVSFGCIYVRVVAYCCSPLRTVPMLVYCVGLAATMPIILVCNESGAGANVFHTHTHIPYCTLLIFQQIFRFPRSQNAGPRSSVRTLAAHYTSQSFTRNASIISPSHSHTAATELRTNV